MKSVSLWLQVHPRAGRTEIVGWHGDAVKVRIKAPPVDGAANDELIRFLAKAIGIPRTAVQITSGTTARRKHVKIEGVDRARVVSSLGL